MLSNVFALITIFRKGNIFSHQLPVTGIERIAEFDNLVSGVINIKLPGDIIAGPIGYCCQDIADRAASGIAHMHRSSRIGGNKLQIEFFPGIFLTPAEIGFQVCHFC